MSITTQSIFYYGLKIDSSNNTINFDEGGGELSAVIDAGTYSYDDLFTAIKTAMEAVGANEYTWAVDRSSRIVSVSSTVNFDLLLSTGTQIDISPWTLLGFNQLVDLTSATSYSGNGPSGDSYTPQFNLQSYVEADNNQERRDPSVNESASGAVEVISFGVVKTFEMGFKYITDLEQGCGPIYNNPTGVADARRFFEFITSRGVFEFMPDIADRDTYNVVLLDSLAGSRTGTGFKLKELTGRNLPNYYEVLGVKLRVVES